MITMTENYNLHLISTKTKLSRFVVYFKIKYIWSAVHFKDPKITRCSHYCSF